MEDDSKENLPENTTEDIPTDNQVENIVNSILSDDNKESIKPDNVKPNISRVGAWSKIDRLPEEDKKIIDDMIVLGTPALIIIRKIKNKYPSIWTKLGDKLNISTLYTHRKKLMRINPSAFHSGSTKQAIPEKDQTDLVLDNVIDIKKAIVSGGKDIDRYSLLMSATTIMAEGINSLKLAADSGDKHSVESLPKYVKEMREVIELMSKMQGELRMFEQQAILGIVNGYMDRVYRAIYKSIVAVCPQYASAISVEAQKNLRDVMAHIKTEYIGGSLERKNDK